MVTSMTRCSRPSGPGHHRHLALGQRFAGIERAAHQRTQRIRLEHQREKGFAARLVDADGEQVLRGDVRVDHAQVGIEHQDARGQRADEVGGLEVRDRGRKEAFNCHAGLRPWHGANARLSCAASDAAWDVAAAGADAPAAAAN